jgi:hypothetical protein
MRAGGEPCAQALACFRRRVGRGDAAGVEADLAGFRREALFEIRAQKSRSA